MLIISWATLSSEQQQMAQAVGQGRSWKWEPLEKLNISQLFSSATDVTSDEDVGWNGMWALGGGAYKSQHAALTESTPILISFLNTR